MIKKQASDAVNRFLNRLGMQLSRIDKPTTKPEIFDSCNEALLFSQGGKESLFRCPVDQITHVTGLGLSKNDWHPFVETIREYQRRATITYSDSTLRTFYEGFQPPNAAQGLIGFKNAPARLRELPPHHIFLLPWTSLSEEEVTIDTLWWNRKDNSEHGRPDLLYPSDGWAFFGPVSNAKGELEFRRTVSLYELIRDNGYDQSKGGVGVTVLKRGNEYRFLLGGGGFHRAIAVRGAGHESVLARFHRQSVVDRDDAEMWPNVRNGLWSKQQAVSLVDHLFEFNSKNWAIKNGFLR